MFPLEIVKYTSLASMSYLLLIKNTRSCTENYRPKRCPRVIEEGSNLGPPVPTSQGGTKGHRIFFSVRRYERIEVAVQRRRLVMPLTIHCNRPLWSINSADNPHTSQEKQSTRKLKRLIDTLQLIMVDSGLGVRKSWRCENDAEWYSMSHDERREETPLSYIYRFPSPHWPQKYSRN